MKYPIPKSLPRPNLPDMDWMVVLLNIRNRIEVEQDSYICHAIRGLYSRSLLTNAEALALKTWVEGMLVGYGSYNSWLCCQAFTPLTDDLAPAEYFSAVKAGRLAWLDKLIGELP